jgi:hypothetical protein
LFRGKPILTADARRIIDLQPQVEIERAARLKAESSLGGARSAVTRLQAKLLEQKAAVAALKADRTPLTG